MSPPASRLIDLALGIPSRESPAFRTAIEEIVKGLPLNAYADDRGLRVAYEKDGQVIPLTAAEVFKAIDPRHPHEVPETVEVLPTQGVRAAFDVYARSLRSAAAIFNKYVGNQPQLNPAILLPIPTFDELGDLISGNEKRNIAGNDLELIPLELRKEEQFELKPNAIREAIKKAHKDEGTLVVGMVHISPHSPTGRTFTYKDAQEIYEATQSLNQERTRKLNELAGGEDRLNELCEKHPDLKRAVDILSRVKIFEDGVYFWSQTGIHTHTSMLELMPRRFPHAADDVFLALSASKIVSGPGTQSGVALTGLKFAKWMDRYLQMPTVGQNIASYAPVHPVFNPHHPNHLELRAYTDELIERLKENRLLVERLVNGTVNKELNGHSAVIDPFTEAAWSKGEIPGVKMCWGGESGMFRLIEFDKKYWQPFINHYVPEAKNDFAMGMHYLLMGHLDTKLTDPAKMLYEKVEDNIFRVNCDKPVEDIIQGLAAIKHAATTLAMPTGDPRQRTQPKQAIIS